MCIIQLPLPFQAFRDYYTSLSPKMNGNMWYLCACFVLFNVISPSSIHVATNGILHYFPFISVIFFFIFDSVPVNTGVWVTLRYYTQTLKDSDSLYDQ